MLPWDHNAYYHRLLLRQIPARCRRVLDVGAGAGELAAALAARADSVDALDRSPVMVEAARRRTPANVDCLLADVMTAPLEPGSYDAVVSVSTLHHLPLEPALQRLAVALRPGGVLAAVALPRRDLPRELPVELLATTWHHLLAVGYAARGALRRSSPDMPVRDPVLTTREVRQRAGTVLPGVRVRRLVLWRYLLVWHKPA